MAQVKILLTDNEETERVDIALEFDPPLEDGAVPTGAQAAAVAFLQHIGAQIEDIRERDQAKEDASG